MVHRVRARLIIRRDNNVVSRRTPAAREHLRPRDTASSSVASSVASKANAQSAGAVAQAGVQSRWLAGSLVLAFSMLIGVSVCKRHSRQVRATKRMWLSKAGEQRPWRPNSPLRRHAAAAAAPAAS